MAERTDLDLHIKPIEQKNNDSVKEMTILHVDDEINFLELTKKFLQKICGSDLIVHSLTDPAMVLENLTETDYDAIVCDYQMPGMDGIQLLELLRSQEIDIPFIIFTGRSREEIAIKALNLGANNYIKKGGDALSQYQHLVHAIKEAVTYKQVERALHESEKEKALILDSMEDLIAYYVTDEMKLLWTNRAVTEALGTSADQLIGKSCMEIWQHDEKACESCPIREASRNGQPKVTEKTTPDGKVWIIKGFPVKNESGVVTGVVELRLDITKQKQAEEKAEDYLRELELILDNVSALIYFKDRENKFIRANKAIADIHGMKRQELAGKSLFDLLPRDEAQAIWDDDLAIIESGKPRLNFDSLWNSPEGRRWFNINKIPLKDKKGDIFGIVGFSIDITERKLAEEKAEDYLRELELILDNIPALVFFKDKENKFIRANKAIADAHDITVEEMAGKSLFDLYPRDQAQEYWDDDLAVIESDNPRLNIDEPWDTSEGRKWVNTSKIPLKDKEGDILGVLGFSIDITERKLAEEKAEEYSNQLEMILDNVPALIFFKDKENKFIRVNKAVADFHGTTCEELAGKSLFDLLPRDQAQSFWDYDLAVINSGKPTLDFDNPFDTPEGRRWVSTSKIPLKDKEGDILGILGFSFDITDRKLAEDKLRESEEKYRILFENAPVGLGFTDKAGNVLGINQKMCQLLGYSREEADKIDVIDTYDSPSDRAKILEQLQTSGRVRDFGVKMKRKNGESFDVLMNADLVTLEGSEVFLTSIRDITEQKQMLKALNEREYQWNVAKRIARLASWEWDITQNTIAWSDGLNQILGITPSELDAREIFFNMVHHDDRERVVEEMSNAIKLCQPFSVEFRMTRQDGIELDVISWGIIISDFNGKASTILGTLQDITDIRKMEKALRKSEESFKSIYEGSPCGIELYDSKGELVDCNEADLNIFGVVSVDHLRGFKLFEDSSISDDNREKLRTGETISYDLDFDFELVKKNNLYETSKSGIIHLFVTIKPMGEKEAPTGYLVYIQDLTERKQAELEIKLLSTAVEQSSESIAVVNLEGYLLFTNKAFAEVHGYTTAELVGQHLSIFHSADQIPAVEAANKQILEVGEFYGEIWHLKRDGTVFPALMHNTLLRDETGSPFGMVATMRDITDRKSEEEERLLAEELLRRQKKYLSQFAHSMAHDLNNSLQIIDGYAQLLEEDYDKTSVERIIKQSKYMKTLLTRSLALADAGLVIDKREGVNLNFLADQVAEVTIPSARIVYNRDTLPKALSCDPEKISQVFKNLFENAVIHGESTRIEVKYDISGKNKAILVVNDGKSIPAEIRDKIFDRGFSTRKGSTGLGLFIVQELVEAHGWYISVHSTVDSTIFRIDYS